MSGESRILLTEVFYSVQGEAARIGVPSIFIRVFGCNLNCPGFGQPRDNMIPAKEMPYRTFDISNVKSIDELPVFNVGCDSSAAWSKRYKHLSKSYTVDELISHIKTLYPKYGYNKPDIVITGGEPLLTSNQPFWSEFIQKSEYENYTFETNGTKELTDETYVAFSNMKDKHFIFSVSPKLSISGENKSRTLNPSAVTSYRTIKNGEVYLKYVIRDEKDMEELSAFTDTYIYHWSDTFGIGNLLRKSQPKLDVWLMPEGATIEGLKLTERKVAELAMLYGLKFTPRLHCSLFGNSWGT